MNSDIKIEIFNDRLAVSSPGSLPDGLTVEDIKQGVNAKRDSILINALDKMNYIENYGSGIRRIYSLYKRFMCQPELIAIHNLFTVILYNMNYKLNTMEIAKNLHYQTRVEVSLFIYTSSKHQTTHPFPSTTPHTLPSPTTAAYKSSPD